MKDKNVNYLLYNRGSATTARQLATLLGLIPINSAERLKRKGGFPTVRYGNSGGEGLFTVDTVFNSPSIIKLCSNSVSFSRWAKENEIFSPEYLPFSKDYDKYPYFLRKAYHHGGLDIIPIESPADLPTDLSGRYIVPFIETDQEIRITVVNGNPVKVMKKVDGRLTGKFPIRSAYKGWHYTLITSGYDKAKEFVSTVSEKLGLKFGAFDLARTADRRYVLWEVNTAPGLNSETIKLYADGLRSTLELI